MRFVMKKKYYEDIRLFKYRSTFFWYLALVIGCVTIPIAFDDYYISILTFICIYSVGALGLMLLAGFTGQVSMGHAAFFAIGSYTAAIITTKGGPFLLALPAAGMLAGLLGILVGLPVLRLSGLYLSIATIALAFIVEEILVRWESLTRGNLGIYVEPPTIGPIEFSSGISLYYLSFVVLIIVILLVTSCGGNTGTTTTPTGTTTTTTTQTTTTATLTTTLDPSVGAPTVGELTEEDFKGPEIPRITAERLKQFIDSDESFTLVDVRDGYQYRDKHLPQAISLPLNTGDEQIAGFLALPKDEFIFVY
jgi:hypothetical protein